MERKEAIARIEAALNGNAQTIRELQQQNVNLERDLHTQVGARLQIEELMAEEAATASPPDNAPTAPKLSAVTPDDGPTPGGEA